VALRPVRAHPGRHAWRLRDLHAVPCRAAPPALRHPGLILRFPETTRSPDPSPCPLPQGQAIAFEDGCAMSETQFHAEDAKDAERVTLAFCHPGESRGPSRRIRARKHGPLLSPG